MNACKSGRQNTLSEARSWARSHLSKAEFYNSEPTVMPRAGSVLAQRHDFRYPQANPAKAPPLRLSRDSVNTCTARGHPAKGALDTKPLHDSCLPKS